MTLSKCAAFLHDQRAGSRRLEIFGDSPVRSVGVGAPQQARYAFNASVKLSCCRARVDQIGRTLQIDTTSSRARGVYNRFLCVVFLIGATGACLGDEKDLVLGGVGGSVKFSG